MKTLHKHTLRHKVKVQKSTRTKRVPADYPPVEYAWFFDGLPEAEFWNVGSGRFWQGMFRHPAETASSSGHSVSEPNVIGDYPNGIPTSGLAVVYDNASLQSGYYYSHHGEFVLAERLPICCKGGPAVFRNGAWVCLVGT
jgi:hypothetical protein